jgi:hypothetical protein
MWQVEVGSVMEGYIAAGRLDDAMIFSDLAKRYSVAVSHAAQQCRRLCCTHLVVSCCVVLCQSLTHTLIVPPSL